MSNAPQRDWLVRDTGNIVTGPFTRDEILQKIRSRRLRGKMEVALCNSYWFCIDEHRELLNFFPELGDPNSHEQIIEATATMTRSELPSTQKIQELESVASDQTTVFSGFKADGGGEWLSEEYAEEFGFEIDSISDTSNQIEGAQKQKSEEVPALPLEQVLPTPATVRQHDHKSVKKNTASAIRRQEDAFNDRKESEAQEPRSGKRSLVIYVSLLAVLVLIALAAYFWFKKSVGVAPEKTKTQSTPLTAIDRLDDQQKLRAAFFTFDVRLMEEILDRIGTKDSFGNALAFAILRGSFKYDPEGALSHLEGIKITLAEGQPAQSEVENLLGIYSLSSNVKQAKDYFKKAISLEGNQPRFQYNLALANFLLGELTEAMEILKLLNNIETGYLAYELFLLQAQVAEESKKAPEEVERLYDRALRVRPSGYEAKLLRAVHRLQQRGLNQSLPLFKEYLLLVPELDPPERAEDFRLAKNERVNQTSLKKIRAFQAMNKSAEIRRDPVIMATDALLAGFNNNLMEANKTIEQAMQFAPGNTYVLIALAQLKYREKRYDEIVDLMKDRLKDSNLVFAAGKLLGHAYWRLDRKSLAAEALLLATKANTSASETWSLLGDLQMDEISSEEMYRSALSQDPLDRRALKGMIKVGKFDWLKQEPYTKLLPF